MAEERSSLCEYPFCLGLGPEWTKCCHNHPKESSESLGPTAKRFKFVQDNELQQLSKGFVPKNTATNTKWALKNFQAWKEARNSNLSQDPVPDNLLETSDESVLNLWLSCYVVETRNGNGEPYPPSTIYQLLSALLRSMRDNNPNCLNFLDKNPKFKMLHGTLNSHFRKLHEVGVGTKVKHSEIISKEEENTLWSSGVMGAQSPCSLLNAVFFCNGKNFCLRGGEEHRKLKLSQLERLSDPDRYVYTENCSKNHAGTFDQLHVQKKVVPVYCTCDNASVTANVRCHVHLLDAYISKLPHTEGTFYLRPLQKLKDEKASPWFSGVPIG